MRHCAITRHEWREPISVLGGWAGVEPCLALISDGRGWSYLMRDFEPVLATSLDPLDNILSPAAAPAGAPPFCGGAAGLASYSLAGQLEALDLGADGLWPPLAVFRIGALLAFDHDQLEVCAIGRGENQAQAEQDCALAAGWLDGARARANGGRLAASVTADDPADFERAVEEVRERIAAGDIFQANIARRWTGRLAAGATPLDLMLRLASQSPAPHAAYLRLPGLALVSNSPERFVSVRGGIAETRPIKGTAPRGASPAEDAANAAALIASAKDRAENLMIVDLMRNDLSRVCEPGSVETPELFALKSFANVHHLVSTVTGRLRPGVTAADLVAAVFPPGSITGAPKVQAMKVISQLEPPRGPFFGSVFWAGFDGAFDSSVLIRTIALAQDADGWAFEARAGGGITADSDPRAERIETEDKISAILSALTEGQ